MQAIGHLGEICESDEKYNFHNFRFALSRFEQGLEHRYYIHIGAKSVEKLEPIASGFLLKRGFSSFSGKCRFVQGQCLYRLLDTLHGSLINREDEYSVIQAKFFRLAEEIDNEFEHFKRQNSNS